MLSLDGTVNNVKLSLYLRGARHASLPREKEIKYYIKWSKLRNRKDSRKMLTKIC